MSFAIRLSADLVTVEAGATTPVSVSIENRSPQADQYELSVEGLDAEWTAIPVPVIAVDSGESHGEKLFLKPPRNTESTAGNYPFVVRVRSLETGDERSVQGVLEIKPFHHLSLEISPKKGFVTPMRRQNQFQLALVNLGNTDHTVRFTSSDPEDALTYEFDPTQVRVAPGQQVSVDTFANPRSARIVSSARLIGFSVAGRSVEVPSVVATSQAQLEQRSLFSPTSLVFMAIVGVLIGLWALFMPRPPEVQTLNVTPRDAVAGETIQIQWNAPQATITRIEANGDLISEERREGGEYAYTIPKDYKSDELEIIVEPERNGMRGRRVRTVVRVRRPEIVPDPVIRRLEASARRIQLGSPFILTYRFENAEKAVLSPDNVTLDPANPSISITPKLTGRVEYTVTVTNKVGKTRSRSFTVEVVDESTARILDFDVSPRTLTEPGGQVIVSWRTTNGRSVELRAGDKPIDIDSGAFVGSHSVSVSAKTTFTLVVYDEQGRPTRQAITVDLKPVEEPPSEPVSPTPTEPGTGGIDGPPPTQDL
jgi:hypothetical protein